jgi:predicted NUDIX family phosphoesterase
MEHLREDILSIVKTEVVELFQQRRSIPETEAKVLVEKFNRIGNFAPREDVENDKQRTQALPVVIIRNRSGEVLRLRRRERSDQNPLHEKIVIWAGGHVRKEDQANGDSMLMCALREVQEELRLSLEPDELTLRGAVYSDLSEKTAQHVAIVYEWRAETDDVAVALSSAEFFERRGTALSGTFVPLGDLARDVDTGKITEPWSAEIVRELLAKGEYSFTGTLF